MQITIHANALHIHLGAEKPSPLSEAEQDARENDLNAPLTEKDLREVAPYFVAAITQKWSEAQVSLREVLALAPIRPLYGHTSGKRGLTHWQVFIKEST